jgi:hypothetical protein
LLAAGGQAYGAEQELVSMLRLITHSPGGSASQPLPLALYAEPGFYFDLGIRDDLGGAGFEQYLERRLQLMSSTFNVQIVDYGPVSSYRVGGTGENWTSVDSSTGFYRIPHSLLPGHVYGWYATALVDDGGGGLVTVQSESIYFHTAGYADFITGEGPLIFDEMSYANSLSLLGQLQQSEVTALRHRLNSSSDYINYPTATDSYICSSVDPPGSHPLNSASEYPTLQLAELLELGRILRDARELQRWLAQGQNPLGQLKGLANQCQLLINRVEQMQSASPATVADLREVARRIGIAESLSGPQYLAPLSELLLLGDKLAGTGTIRLNATPLEAFADYSQSSDRRLRQLSDMDPALYNLLGARRGQFWQEFFRGQRAELALLREDIRNGLVKDSDLEFLLAQARNQASLSLPEAFDGNEAKQYADALAAFAKLAPSGNGTADSRSVLELQLIWIAASIWPRDD